MAIAKHIAGLADLLKVADAAFRWQLAEEARREAADNLDRAYGEWKHRHDIYHVDRDSLDWIRMMHATRSLYDVLQRAKNRERHARRRLFVVVARQRNVDAGLEPMREAA